ncbi:hypothetical protein [Anaeromyxobacter oryzae]|uniref:Outer membrane protein beta-barrel domain-containing protein n=1 Tax=Anaeromyxobacter oryzae TaxID=2918170 RepID=A0ABN6MW38_9BACT|nr:hypothetical protein [Anaeromyxobacter oryzae]BDG03885.1 hypothetical protein AMOR_28810 [Anaeromyxobacter oryzae]
MVRVLLALVCLAAAVPAHAAPLSLGIEATIGSQHLGVNRAPGTTRDLSPMGDAGATVLLRAGPLMLGAAMEGNFSGSTLRRYNASALGGLATDLLPVLRLELLGEVGAANLRSTSELRQAASGGWNRFYGFRPGLSVKLPVLPFRVGAWGLARWGLPGATRSPELGLLGRIGFEF